MDLFIFILVASPFVIFACYMLWVGLSSKSKAQRAKSWPTADGIVLESQVKQEIRHTSQGDRFYYEPHVLYEYEVQGKRIQGKRIHLNYAQGVSEKAAKKMVAQYPVGSRVPIYYNPSHPEEAVLAHVEVSLKLSLGIFIFVMALLSFIFWADYAGGCKAQHAQLLSPHSPSS